MRFDVADQLSNVHKVNISVYLTDGREWNYSNVQNPKFWNNSTYGRVIWDPTIFNGNVSQVTAKDIERVVIVVQDGFGNTRLNTIHTNGTKEEQVIIGNDSLIRLPDKEKIPHSLSPPVVTYPRAGDGCNGIVNIEWIPLADYQSHIKIVGYILQKHKRVFYFLS